VLVLTSWPRLSLTTFRSWWTIATIGAKDCKLRGFWGPAMNCIVNVRMGVLALVWAATLVGRAGAGPMAEYRIGPLDSLDVTVFQIQDLSLKKVQVDAGGRLRLPLIGAVDAGGRTAAELSADIAARLREKYLQDPQVAVVVVEALTQKVTVEGAVNEAGVFPLKGRTGLLEAVAEAKGESRTGNPRRVAIVRNVDGAPHAARFDLTAIRAGRARDPEVVAGDTVVVDGSRAGILWRNLVETLPALVVFSYL
jgi:polysaccharide export outer membrane protein